MKLKLKAKVKIKKMEEQPFEPNELDRINSIDDDWDTGFSEELMPTPKDKDISVSRRLGKINQLMKSEGIQDEEHFIRAYLFDSISPGICINPDCNYTTQVEPDSDCGYCEECGTQSVWSGLRLMGMI